MAIWMVLFVKNVDIPLYFGADWQFVGINRLLSFQNLIALLSLIMIVVASFSLIQLRHRLNGSPDSLSTTIIDLQDKNYEFINMLTTIVTLFSVIFVPVNSLRDFVVFLILMIAISTCFLKTNLFYCNPIFSALGYRLYKVTTSSGTLPNDSVAIIHGTLHKQDSVCYIKVTENVLYLIPNDNH